MDHCCKEPLTNKTWWFINWERYRISGKFDWDGDLTKASLNHVGIYPCDDKCEFWHGVRYIPHPRVCESCLRKVGLLW